LATGSARSRSCSGKVRLGVHYFGVQLVNDPDFRIRNVSDTARWVASFRAAETQRADALFHDPHAERLAGARGFQIAKMLARESEQGSNPGWAWVARTHQFDKFISNVLAGGIDLVLNLAAGLDARAYRMELPPTLHWVEVDLPEIIAYKEEMLANEKPKCGLERIALDLSDVEARRAILRKVNARANRIAVISEGSLVYFSPEEVAVLARDLSCEPHFDSWIIDISSAIQLASMQRSPLSRHLRDVNVEFKFGPAEGLDFFKAYGWEPKEIKGLLETAAENNRAPKEFLSLLPDPRPVPPNYPWTGVCLLQKSE
jgi:methyltransferase (TIGR00027 family)